MPLPKLCWTDGRGNYSPMETLTCNQRCEPVPANPFSSGPIPHFGPTWTDGRGNYSPVETLTCNQRVEPVPANPSSSGVSDAPGWTPGPWVALSISGGLTPPPLRVVATAPVHVKGSTLIASGFRPDEPEATANLQLIAAAPDLYAALSFADILLAFLASKATTTPTVAKGLHQAHAKASAALLKANPARGSVTQSQPTVEETGTGSKEKR